MALTQQEAVQSRSRKWPWALACGIFTMLLAIVAFFLPAIEWMPSGGLVGWLLLAAGICELGFGWQWKGYTTGKAAIGSGAITILAGLTFVANPLAGFFSVVNVVMLWLIVRGAWMLAMASRVRDRRRWPWLALSGATDALLGFALGAGLPVATLVVAMFGPTREIVAQFALLLAASFAITGLSQVAIALAQRATGPAPGTSA